MTAGPRWISKKALVLLHEESLSTFGGASGLRDEGLLDSALARPQNAHACNWDSTLADLAAAYGFGLAKNHAFVEGSKRGAFLSIGVFLAINGVKLVAAQVEAIQIMLAVAAGEVDERGLGVWIQENSVPKERWGGAHLPADGPGFYGLNCSSYLSDYFLKAPVIGEFGRRQVGECSGVNVGALSYVRLPLSW